MAAIERTAYPTKDVVIGREFFRALKELCGVGDEPVRKLKIECEEDFVPRIEIERWCSEDDERRAASARRELKGQP